MISYVFDVLNEMSYAVFLYDTSQNMFIIKYRNMALTVRLSFFSRICIFKDTHFMTNILYDTVAPGVTIIGPLQCLFDMPSA